ncbi:MAG: SRPBCC family protein [Leucobacter sp.]
MSKITAAAATSHTLSVTAMEEASRLGERTADIDHMLLALVVNEQTAGQVLRSLGITLDTAREAVAAQHAAQLASLGVQTTAPTPGRITFHETGDYEWGPRSLAIIKRSAEGGKRGDAAAVLRELAAEPSGFVEAVLHRLDTTPEAVRARLDEVAGYPAPPQHIFEPSTLSGTSESFAPAAAERVWDLLADPSRMPEWEPGTASVENAPTQFDAELTAELTAAPAEPAEPTAGSSWIAHARTERPDGKPVRVKPRHRTSRVELIALEPRHAIEWRFTWPDAPGANARRVRVELEPAAGGTHLRLSLAWERNQARARSPFVPLRRIMRPLHRFAIWMQLSQLGGSIGRAFR